MIRMIQRIDISAPPLSFASQRRGPAAGYGFALNAGLTGRNEG
jgi:hypothetical protein